MFSKLKKAVLLSDNLYYYNLVNAASLTGGKFSLDQFIRLRMLHQSLLDSREELGYLPKVELRLRDLYMYLTMREVVKLTVNKERYEKEEFKIMIEHMIGDELFYQCLTLQEMNENWTDSIKEVLTMAADRKYDEMVNTIIKIVRENQALSRGLLYNGKPGKAVR